MFELQTPTAAKLCTLTPRTEKHGDDEVSALSMGLKIIGANTLLDLLSPTLRDALYTAVPGQDQLPGVEQHTPLRRTKDIESMVLPFAFEGWTLRIDYGADEDDPLVLGACKVDKFRLSVMEGGTIELSFRVGTSDVDERDGGILFGKMGHELSITLSAPLPDAAAETIDGTTQAFEHDHPSEDDSQASILDAMQGAPHAA